MKRYPRDVRETSNEISRNIAEVLAVSHKCNM